ncbi:low affinity potassium transporter Kup [Vogesella oryzae]|uniref:low affinity potassium transporter Kup n=1 Tax=Vogesella oryzae TaxID=1735285 RepID=UPI001581760E|nr:low affinity potassium transporter Kup [Vogesella oryzae]
MQAHNKQALAGITLAAMGVVYGDIGTSPLYTLKECFSPHLGLAVNEANVLGILSLIVWGLILVVSLKYLSLVLRADNRGEGGILTLMALARRYVIGPKAWLLGLLGLMGGGFFYGEVVITPAISVLSAVEGLEVITPAFKPYVLPIAIAVLAGLFLIQKHGTASVGKLFGPVMMLWFASLAALGLHGVVHNPAVLAALNPLWGIDFMLEHRAVGFLALGSVVLALTGAEALYADMGHFGARPIRLAWFLFVLPALLLNYFGQGAEILSNVEARANPFFHLAPDWALLPLVVLSTFATVIASQAVISGVFSLTRQAVQLGFLPRMEITHTSDHEIGQIYIPLINWGLLVAVIAVVVMFQSSSALAGAYGIAVTGTMVITSILVCSVALRGWHWPAMLVAPLLVALLIIDVPLFAANVVKILAGGWLPLTIGVAAFIMMSTWKQGRKLLMQRLNEMAIPLEGFIENMETYSPDRVQGTAVFLTSTTNGVPHALLHNLKHNKVLHERVVLMTIRSEEVPYVEQAQRIQIERLSNSFWRVLAAYGFKETPNVQEILDLCEQQQLSFELMDTSFFLSRETLIQTDREGLAPWREKLFVWMSRNALRATDFFQIPSNRVVEMGAQVEL